MVGLRPASSISGSRPRGGRGSAGVPASSWSQLSSSANPLRARAVPSDRRELRVNFRRKFQTRIPRKFRLYWTDVDRFRLLTRGLSDTTQSRGFAANLGRGAAFAAIWGEGPSCQPSNRRTGSRAAPLPVWSQRNRDCGPRLKPGQPRCAARSSWRGDGWVRRPPGRPRPPTRSLSTPALGPTQALRPRRGVGRAPYPGWLRYLTGRAPANCHCPQRVTRWKHLGCGRQRMPLSLSKASRSHCGSRLLPVIVRVA